VNPLSTGGFPPTLSGMPPVAVVMLVVSLGWGCSFLFIRESLLVTDPYGVALSRVALGAFVLGLLPASRRRMPRRAWGWLLVLALTWMAVPMVLFALAERDVSSATAGMINGSAPVFTAAVAAVVTRTAPRGQRLAGLGLGLLGVVAIGLPGAGTESGADASIGVLLVVAAVALYGVAFNIAGRLQREHGALPVIWRSMMLAALVLAPVGVPDLLTAAAVPHALVSVLLLGVVSTGVCFALFAWLAGTLDPTRASVVTYAVPVIALAVGVLFGRESVHPLALGGVALVVAAAYLVQRAGPASRSAAG
jgi:drug/metabolite transporter (DMT)-like permease